MRHEERLYKRSKANLPAKEGFKFRAQELSRGGTLRLCDWCLKTRPRCFECFRQGSHQRSWKRYRAKQWRI